MHSSVSLLVFVVPYCKYLTIPSIKTFFYKTISKLREKRMPFNQIAGHLNRKKILSVRGKTFRGGHVHSIMKRKRVRDKKLEREYPEVRSDFYLDIYDKSIIFKI